MLALESLLQPFGFDPQARKRSVKLVRHADARVDVPKLYRDGLFDLYQAYQSAPVFNSKSPTSTVLDDQYSDGLSLALVSATSKSWGSKAPPIHALR